MPLLLFHQQGTTTFRLSSTSGDTNGLSAQQLADLRDWLAANSDSITALISAPDGNAMFNGTLTVSTN